MKTESGACKYQCLALRGPSWELLTQEGDCASLVCLEVQDKLFLLGTIVAGLPLEKIPKRIRANIKQEQRALAAASQQRLIVFFAPAEPWRRMLGDGCEELPANELTRGLIQAYE